MATPLRAFSFDALQAGAQRWQVANPGRSASVITRSERQRSFLARAAFAIATAEENASGRAVGASPCLKCGLWTHAYCEGCSNDNLGPICTSCDSQFLLCPVCEQAGLTWQQCRNARIERQGPQPVMEINGIHDGEGRWVILGLRLVTPDEAMGTEPGLDETLDVLGLLLELGNGDLDWRVEWGR